jgi:hypothetical protein
MAIAPTLRSGWIAAGIAAAIPSAAIADGQTGYASRLIDYRADHRCTGPSFEAVLATIDQNLNAYHMQDPANARLSVSEGRLAAAQIDGLASVAAAKGCKVQALGSWRFVIRFFDGPVFTDLQQRAVAGLRSLRAPPPG